jgi:hypothetical protein
MFVLYPAFHLSSYILPRNRQDRLIPNKLPSRTIPCELVGDFAGLSPRSPGRDPWSVRVRFVVDEVAPRQGFSPSPSVFPVSIIQPMLHTFLHLRVALTRRTNGAMLETFQRQCFFGSRGAFGRKVLTLFK